MKHTVTTENEKEFKLIAHHLDAYRMIDCLDVDLCNGERKYKNEVNKHEIGVREGLLLAHQLFRDNMEQFNLYGLYNPETEEE